MRQSQQNRRSRGRSNNNNNRKGQNPLTRSYESNGPDVKIRGTPSHIAEKYVTMARDALSSGDPVLAENYLQHAEHYNRIIMTYREQQVPQSNEHANNGRGRGPSSHEPSSHDNGDADSGNDDDQMMRTDSPPPGSEPQPSFAPAEAPQSEERSSRRRSSSSRDRGDRNDRSASNDRGSKAPEDAERTTQASQEGSSGRSRSRRTRYAQTDDQPEFLKRPVRRPRSSEGEDTPEESAKSDEAAE